MPTKIRFKVIHVSGQDDSYRAAELNNHCPTTKGWQSARFCLYPQDIVLQLERRCRLRKIQLLSHQFNIATKIEFYVGDGHGGDGLQTARFVRLGYVSLSDNEKTGYKARELKSVHVDAEGSYLKLIVHKNHVNKFNLYNQVGIVAINVIGDRMDEYHLEQQVDNRTAADPALEGLFNRPDYISPLDDLAFDMYQDPEIAQIIRKLERKKQDAVLQEKYDYAKRLKHAIAELQKESARSNKTPENAPISARYRPLSTANPYLPSTPEEPTLPYIQSARNEEPKPFEQTYEQPYEQPYERQYEQSYAPRERLPPISEESPRPRVRTIHIDTEELIQNGMPPQLEFALEKDEVLNISLDLTHHTVGEKLGKMEVEKRQAVENEDYDKAKGKKLQMDEYRIEAYKKHDVPNLLEMDEVRNSQQFDYEQIRQTTPPRYRDYNPPRRSPTPPRYDERPLPISHREPSPKLDPVPDPDPAQSPPKAPEQQPPGVYDERPLPIHKSAIVVEDEPEPEADVAAGEPEPMTEKDIRDASSAIDVFGHPLVSKAYSKTWSYREDSLLAVYKQMQGQPSSIHKEEARSTMRAAIFLVRRAIEDKVYAVFKAALQLEQMILTEYVPRHKIPRSETVSAVERTIPNLLHKSGDTAIRNRDDTKRFIQDMANFPEVRPTNVVPNECLRPVKPSMAPRLAESRVEIVETLYKDLGLGSSGLNVDNLMPFCVEALNHNAGEVREVSERIIKSLYKDVGGRVKDYLPPDNDKTRKNTLWRQLFEYFDKVDGKPSKSDVQKRKAEEETKKQAEIDALQKQLQQLKDMAAGKAPIDQNLVKGGRKGAQPSKPKPKAKQKPPPKVSEDDDVSVANMDKICIFCGEKNESFNDEGLDLHYWKNCPMLKRCAYCKQVVEIASLTDHLLGECEAKNSFSKCPRCSEAIVKTDYDQHVSEKTCNPSKSNTSHCPLCHQNLDNGEDGWKKHLMGESGCKQNTRRLMALDKQGPQQSRLPAPRSRVPTKAKGGRR